MTALLLDETIEKYEQDLRELLMAFFPGEKFCYEEKPEAGLFLWGKAGGLTLFRRETGEEMGTGAEAENRAETGTGTGAEGRLIPAGSRSLCLTGQRREDKSLIKTALYSLLAELTGESLPWGTLTGIRPVKLAEMLLAEGNTAKEAEALLQERYLTSREKASLAVEIAERERRLLAGFPYRKGFSLYVGIPFCPTTCLYCSFTSYPISKWRDRAWEYLEDLALELQQVRRMQETEGSLLYGKPLQTIYVGGGTPTSLDEAQLRKLLSEITGTFDLSGLREFTVEAGRPDSITEGKLAALRDFSVDRISINPQTMNQKTLDLIGRRHTVEDVKEAFAAARAAGFDNINMDMIVGLPKEDLEDVAHTLSEIRALGPDSLTVHALAVKRAARLNTEGNAWAHLARAGKAEAAEMTALSEQTAEALGLKPYYLYRQKNMAGNQENVGYAAEGKENLYNILMMEELHTVVGCGAGASTKAVVENEDPGLYGGNAFRVERFENIKNVAEYLPRIQELLEKKEKFLKKA